MPDDVGGCFDPWVCDDGKGGWIVKELFCDTCTRCINNPCDDATCKTTTCSGGHPTDTFPCVNWTPSSTMCGTCTGPTACSKDASGPCVGTVTCGANVTIPNVACATC